jgi:hypothetical protein
MLTVSAVSSLSLETIAVTPDAASPVVMVVRLPVAAHCTAWLVPASVPLTVTCAVPATSVPGSTGAAAGSEEHPANARPAAATKPTLESMESLCRSGLSLGID